MIAKNRCTECTHEWQDRPMGFAIHVACPKCGSPYWRWTNYDTGMEARRATPSISFVETDDL